MKIFSKEYDEENKHVIIRIFNIKLSFRVKTKLKFPKDAICAQKVLTTPENLVYKQKTATIFAMFNKDGLILDNTINYLRELRKYSDFLVIVSDCPMLKMEIEKVSNLVDAYIFKRHKEYDFGSYKRGFLILQKLNILENVDNLIFCNDSVLFNGISIEEIVSGVKTYDFYGVTINKTGYSKKLVLDAIEPHIQSYFVSVSKNIFEKQFFIDFINSIKREKNKLKIVYKYEQGLSRTIAFNGFDMHSYYPVRENDDIYSDPFIYYLNEKSSYRGKRFFHKKRLVD